MTAPLRVALLGCGTVGGAVAAELADPAAAARITRLAGRRLELAHVLVRDGERRRAHVDPSLITTDPAVALDDPDVELVIEVMGGVEGTRKLIAGQLRAGRDVVTANKQLLARHGGELLEAAVAGGARLRFEAAACGAVPVVRTLRESLAAADVRLVEGIVNGTSNYVLSTMAATGGSYDDALADATRLGYAEADPTEDVGGADAAAKLAILATLAFGVRVTIDDVPYEGITRIHGDDLAYAREFGYAVKLLARAELVDGRVLASVSPALLPLGDHPLASVGGALNGVLLESPTAGRVTLSGPGAGGPATASAIIGDVIGLANARRDGPLEVADGYGDAAVAGAGDRVGAFYVHADVADRPGVLARVADAFGRAGVSIRTVIQRGTPDAGDARLVLVTHPGPEPALRGALASIAADPGLCHAVPRALPVIER